MNRCKGDVLYVGKAKNIRKRIVAYTATGYDPRIERMIAATARLESSRPATETEALLLEANLINAASRFNVLLPTTKSFPYILITADHWRRRSSSTAVRIPARVSISVRSLGRSGQPHHHPLHAAPFCCAPAPTGSSTAAPGMPALPDQALLRSCTREIEFAEYGELGARGHAFCRAERAGEGRAHRRDGEGVGRARFRGALRSTATGSPRCRQCSPGRTSIRAAWRRPTCSPSIRPAASAASRCSSPHRPELGQSRLFPKADRSLAAGEVLGAFLAQFYDDKPVHAASSSRTSSRSVHAGGGARTKSGFKVEVSVPQRGEKKTWSTTRSPMRARRWTQARRDLLPRQAADGAGRALRIGAGAPAHRGLRQQPHPGHQSVGAMIVAAQGFQKNQYRKFNIRSADLVPGDDFGMMREVLSRRFKRLINERRACRRRRHRCRRPARAPQESIQDDAAVARRSRLGQRGDGGGIALADLVLIDGGRGQLSAAQETLAALGITDLPLVGVAKDRSAMPGSRPSSWPAASRSSSKPRDPVLYFVQRLRDEAHRFRSARTASGAGAIFARRACRKFRHRADPQARTAPSFRDAQGDRARRARRPRQGPRHQRETARKIYDFFHERAEPS